MHYSEIMAHNVLEGCRSSCDDGTLEVWVGDVPEQPTPWIMVRPSLPVPPSNIMN